MKVIKFDNEEAWYEGRKGIITGTKAGKLLSVRDKKPLKGFYTLLVDRVAIPSDGESAMLRGKRLESEAVERFAKETGKKVNTDLVICLRDDNSYIGYSPDALIGKTEDVEVKCQDSENHLEAWLSQQIPSEYESQVIQGFVVNDKLKTRYLVFYDPRMPIDFFYMTIKREDYKDKIDEYLQTEREILEKIALLEKQLTF